jgi:hypothetical protein
VPQFFKVKSTLVPTCSSFHASLHVQLAAAVKALPEAPDAKSRYLLAAAARQYVPVTGGGGALQDAGSVMRSHFARFVPQLEVVVTADDVAEVALT